MLSKNKAQTAIEMLLVATIILVFSIIILSYFFGLNDSTYLMIASKTEALKTINKSGKNCVIEKITVFAEEIEIKVNGTCPITEIYNSVENKKNELGFNSYQVIIN